jgi:hypothetical protein
MRGNLRCLGDHRDIGIAETISVGFGEAAHGAQKLAAVASRIDGIVIRKQLPDITASEGAQQRIAKRVYQNITIGMGDYGQLAGDIDATETDSATGAQCMHVITVSDSRARRHR